MFFSIVSYTKAESEPLLSPSCVLECFVVCRVAKPDTSLPVNHSYKEKSVSVNCEHLLCTLQSVRSADTTIDNDTCWS